MADPLVSVVVGSYNRRRFLRAALESVRDELEDLPSEIIVVEGGSTDGTIKWLVKQKDVTAIIQHNRGAWRGRPIERRSWGHFMNLGFRAATAPVICMLSDDSLLVRGAIRNGLNVLERGAAEGERIGAVAFWWRDWPVETSYRVGVTFGERQFVNYGLFVADALREVGYADEEAFAFYHADGDLGLRLDQAGYTCVTSTDSYVEHYPDANPRLRRSNLEHQPADWAAYRGRWAHLGDPERDWHTKHNGDADDTPLKYWPRIATSRSSRRVAHALSQGGELVRQTVRRGS